MALTRINNNSLSNVTAAGIPGHGSLTNFEIWEIQSNIDADANPITTWARQSEASLGTAITQSSGIFTLPSTGYWLIQLCIYSRTQSGSQVIVKLDTTTDNSTYTTQAITKIDQENTGGQIDVIMPASYIFDVTNTSTHKFKTILDLNDASNHLGGYTDGRTHMTIIRLGDT